MTEAVSASETSHDLNVAITINGVQYSKFRSAVSVSIVDEGRLITTIKKIKATSRVPVLRPGYCCFLVSTTVYSG
jgi:hypothetical protein